MNFRCKLISRHAWVRRSQIDVQLKGGIGREVINSIYWSIMTAEDSFTTASLRPSTFLLPQNLYNFVCWPPARCAAFRISHERRTWIMHEHKLLKNGKSKKLKTVEEVGKFCAFRAESRESFSLFRYSPFYYLNFLLYNSNKQFFLAALWPTVKY